MSSMKYKEIDQCLEYNKYTIINLVKNLQYKISNVGKFSMEPSSIKKENVIKQIFNEIHEIANNYKDLTFLILK